MDGRRTTTRTVGVLGILGVCDRNLPAFMDLHQFTTQLVQSDIPEHTAIATEIEGF